VVVLSEETLLRGRREEGFDEERENLVEMIAEDSSKLATFLRILRFARRNGQGERQGVCEGGKVSKDWRLRGVEDYQAEDYVECPTIESIVRSGSTESCSSGSVWMELRKRSKFFDKTRLELSLLEAVGVWVERQLLLRRSSTNLAVLYLECIDFIWLHRRTGWWRRAFQSTRRRVPALTSLPLSSVTRSSVPYP
jgi:hypothetical protein